MLSGIKEATTNFNNMCDIIGNFFKGCGKFISFISKSLTDPSFLIDKIQGVAPGIILVTLTVLIILRFIGFKDTTKWIALALVVAAIIANL